MLSPWALSGPILGGEKPTAVGSGEKGGRQKDPHSPGGRRSERRQNNATFFDLVRYSIKGWFRAKKERTVDSHREV